MNNTTSHPLHLGVVGYNTDTLGIIDVWASREEDEKPAYQFFSSKKELLADLKKDSGLLPSFDLVVLSGECAGLREREELREFRDKFLVMARNPAESRRTLEPVIDLFQDNGDGIVEPLEYEELARLIEARARSLRREEANRRADNGRSLIHA